MPGIPEQWVYNALLNGAGGPVSVSAPAASGISHVLDALSVRFGNSAAAAATIATIITVTDGATVVWQTILAVPAGVAVDSVDAQVPVAGTPGNALTVTSSAVLGAGQFVSITATGHDV